MKQKQITTNALIEAVSLELEKLGYVKSYVWGSSYNAMLSIQKYHRLNGHTLYSPDIAAEFIAITDKRYADGEICREYKSSMHRAVKRLDEYFFCERLSCICNTYEPKPTLCSEFQNLLDKFMASGDFHENTAWDFIWAIRKYLLFLQNRGHSDMSDVTLSDVRDFMTETSKALSTGSLHNIQCYVRKFHVFLREHNIVSPDCLGLLSYRIPRQLREKNYITDDELQKLLAQIDTNTIIGKRDSAIILLGAFTGLRAIDIVQLKLSDIDWVKGEIHIIQSKTGNDLYLPVTADVGNAIQEYILHCRPQTDRPEVFIRLMAPYIPMKAVNIGCIFNKYLSKAGITREPFDGKTFHGLRRRLGHNLLQSGSSVNVIAQILGHTSVNSTERYLSLDFERLKLCALDFNGITPVGGTVNE